MHIITCLVVIISLGEYIKRVSPKTPKTGDIATKKGMWNSVHCSVTRSYQLVVVASVAQ